LAFEAGRLIVRNGLVVIVVCGVAVLAGCGGGGDAGDEADSSAVVFTEAECLDLIGGLYSDPANPPDSFNEDLLACRQAGLDPVYEANGIDTIDEDYFARFAAAEAVASTVAPEAPAATAAPATAPPPQPPPRQRQKQ